MANKALQDYIDRELVRGVSKEDLREVLVGEGWNSLLIDRALDTDEKAQPSTPLQTSDTSVNESVDGKQIRETEDSTETLSTQTTYGDVGDQPVVTSGGIGESGKDDTDKTSSKRKLPKPKISVIVIVIILLLLGAVYLGYRKVYLSPKKITQSMLQAMGEVKSFKYSGSLEILTDSGFDSSTLPVAAPESLTVSMDGAIDTFEVNNKQYSVTAGIGTQDISLGEYSLVFDTGDIYFKVIDPGFLALVLQDNLTSEDWAKLSLNELENKYSLPVSASSIEDARDEDLSKLSDIFVNNNFIVLGDMLPSEKVGGVASYHFSYEVDKEKFGAFLLEVNRVFNAQSADDYSEEVGEFLAGLESIEGEVWVGKDNNYLTGLSLSAVLNDVNTGGKYVIDFTIVLSEHNQPNLIQVPTNYVSLDEFVGEGVEIGIIDEGVSGLPLDTEGESDVVDVPASYLPKELQDEPDNGFQETN
jgi:hypothetical protein